MLGFTLMVLICRNSGSGQKNNNSRAVLVVLVLVRGVCTQILDDTFLNSEHPQPHDISQPREEKKRKKDLKVKNLTLETSEEKLKSHRNHEQNK